MATLETIRYVPHRPEVATQKVTWQVRNTKIIETLPQIMWANNTPWREANLWALEKAKNKKSNIKTVWSAMTHIHAYAKWLEAENTAWWHFPARESERCLVRFRGFLIDSLEHSELAPSTAQKRMNAVIRFYRWLQAMRLLSPEWPMWNDRQIGVRLNDKFGLERTMSVETTDLAIPNRKSKEYNLEDGLFPVASSEVAGMLSFARKYASEELALMLQLGFGTGMRIGTLTDLKVATINRAVPSPLVLGFYCLAVGPGAHPTVHTKFGVTGQVIISEGDLAALRSYIQSPRRLKRKAKACLENSEHVFLTRYGELYGHKGVESSKSINVELGRLRKLGIAANMEAFNNFRFHQTRCTFATELARVIIKYGSVSMAIDIVKSLLLHKDESTTLKYIKFVEATAAMSEAANEFTRKFLGLDPLRNKA
ncbi:site-specific integrase [Pseudomonas sp. Y5-11]|uniref:site-specific integrase n=1 Tax=Pseudomonas TaxID=286 RepID=UPI000518B78B|nr:MULTISPECIES: site-specific integrase [Pseudomonas]ULN81107.1 site-specific integrase [Pseudomonas sp. Y5-11]